MIHFVKNLGDKLVDVHSVGQNKVCAENNRSHKETNAGNPKKSSKTNTYIILQQLIGLAPQQQLLVSGMNMEIIYIHSLVLQVCFAFVWTFCLTMFMLIFLGLSFLHVWCLFFIFTCVLLFLQTEALPPANPLIWGWSQYCWDHHFCPSFWPLTVGALYHEWLGQNGMALGVQW